jgi:Protein of unknown function (DUF2934)
MMQKLKPRRMDNVVRTPIVESPSLPTDETSHNVTDDEVAHSAFALYCERGRHDGHDIDDWLQAERKLRGPAKST